MISDGEFESRIIKEIKNKNVLYITTKNRDYLRIEQEISLINKHAKNVTLITSSNNTYAFRLLFVYIKILFHFKSFDVVFIGFAPQLVLPFFYWRYRNKTIIIDFFISLYDTLIFDRKLFKRNSIIAVLLKKLDSVTLAFSDLIICDTREHCKYFINDLGASPDKTTVLYLEADNNYYYPKVCEKPDNVKDKFIVLYFGSALPLQGIETIIDAIKTINCSDIYFIIIGPIDNKLKSDNLDNITFIDWLAQEDLSAYIAFSDLCLAGHFSSEIEKARRVIPGKAYIYEAMNKHMILGDNPANRERYPALYEKVTFVQMGNVKSLCKAILNEYERRKHV